MLVLQDRSLVEEEASGQTLGFARHGEQTKKALKRLGVKFSDEARTVLHQVPSFYFKPVEGKKNILYTAWEAPDLPDDYVEPAKKADLIICVSDFVARAYKKRLPNKPIVTVPLGVDINAFNYLGRRKYVPEGPSPFVYLWVGAPDYRKGHALIREAWKAFEHDKSSLLFIKTTGRNRFEQAGNVFVESRKLDVKSLAKIYQMAHCFIFPSFAEGFGLPLAEAMSTGLPSIFVPWGGVKTFANRKNAFPLRYQVVSIDYGVPTSGAQADLGDMISKMQWVKANYRKAVAKGKAGRRTIENDFTWDDTGRKIKKIIEEFLRYGTISG